ncbi:protein ALP1-like [Pecten maximus]|uniref:protein ALP1-like n=1 Tax=Pecten maximus TaxID=6579 RepID=UPI001458CA9C|nr:protein ALP1-like [Pecten maximus]
MANTESMREIGQYFGIGKSTVHITLERVTEAVVDLLKVIKWPDFPTQLQIAKDIHLPYGLPDIVVVDQDLLITNCYTGWAGCAHDARVLRNSSLYEKAEAGGCIIPGKVIVADSAYPLKDWLVTPFKDNGHLNHNQRRFNRILSSGRQIGERAIGHIKGRFRRLQEIPVHEPRFIVSLITCGCIMHNLCIISHDNLDTYMNYDDDNNHPNNFPNIFQNDVGGVARRQILMNAMN